MKAVFMKTKIFLVLILFCGLAISYSYGQSSQEIEVIKQRAKEKVKMLNDNISFIANPRKKMDTRAYYKEEAQKLFIHGCNSYKEILEFANGTKKEEIHKDGVTMGVASTRNTTPRQKPMKQYFRGLMTMGYKSVTIETTDIADMRVSKLQPYGKDENGRMLYTCSVYFDQVFIGQRGDGGTYKDLTRKWVVCYVQVDHVLDEETGETKPEYMVRLGDVYVISVEKIF